MFLKKKTVNEICVQCLYNSFFRVSSFHQGLSIADIKSKD